VFAPNNDLEISLVKASTDPSHRPQFLRDLLASNIFLMTPGDTTMDVRDGVLQQGTTIAIQPWQRDGKDWLPIFSSLQLLRQNLKTESAYLQLNAKDFLEFTRGAHVILNPNCDYGKEFFPEEISGLLDGSIYEPRQTTTIKKDTRVLLGQPKEYPSEFVKALSNLFANHRNVRAAYLAHYFNPESGDPPHLLIGIDAEGESQAVLGEAGMVASDVLPPGELVDFIRITPNEAGVSQYLLRESKAFYQRSLWRSLFR
jgi:hypothetical protein